MASLSIIRGHLLPYKVITRGIPEDTERKAIQEFDFEVKWKFQLGATSWVQHHSRLDGAFPCPGVSKELYYGALIKNCDASVGVSYAWRKDHLHQ